MLLQRAGLHYDKFVSDIRGTFWKPLTIDPKILDIPAVVQADPILARYVQGAAGQASVVATALGHLTTQRRPLIYVVGSEALKTATGLATLVSLRNRIEASGASQLVNLVYVHTDPAMSPTELFATLRLKAEKLFDVIVSAVGPPTEVVRTTILDAVNANLEAYRKHTGQTVETLPPVKELNRQNTVTFASNAQESLPVEQRHQEERIFQELVTDAIHVLVQQPDSTDAKAVADYSRAVTNTLVALSESREVPPELQQDIDAVKQVVAEGGTLTIPPRPSSILHDLDQQFKAQRVVRSNA